MRTLRLKETSLRSHLDNNYGLNLKHNDSRAGSANFFCKGSNGKYFSLWEPRLSHGIKFFLFIVFSHLKYVNLFVACGLYKKWTVSQSWPMGHSSLTSALHPVRLTLVLYLLYPIVTLCCVQPLQIYQAGISQMSALSMTSPPSKTVREQYTTFFLSDLKSDH